MTSHPHLCPRCKTNPSRSKQSYCSPCQAEYVAEWRRNNQRSNGHGKKVVAVARRATRSPELCECGSAQVRATRPDPTRPLFIKWCCEPCAAMRSKVGSAA